MLLIQRTWCLYLCICFYPPHIGMAGY